MTPIIQPRMAVAQMGKNPFFKIKDGENVTIRFLDTKEQVPAYYTHEIAKFEPCKQPHVPATEYTTVTVLDEEGSLKHLRFKKSTYDKILQLAEKDQNEHGFIQGWRNFIGHLKQLWCKITGKEPGIRKLTILQ